MKDILEKLTLYDFLGYAFPGSIVVLTLVFCCGNVAFWKAYKDLLPYITFAAGILSYLSGLLLSEATAEIQLLFKEKALQKEFEEWSDERTFIAAAIKKHRNDSNPVEINNVKHWEKCMKYMYSAVQIAPETKRVHNYASTEVMCRNLSLACLVSGVILSIRFSWYVVLAVLPFALLMKKRAKRFGQKKRAYTIYWFLQNGRLTQTNNGN